MSDQLQIITKFYEQAFQQMNSGKSVPAVEVEFYPYVGINHTIRFRSGKVFVRIADIFRAAPLEAQNALALILTAKLLRKKIPQNAEKTYDSFIKTPELRRRAAENKRAKGRKVITGAKGDFYDLDRIFNSINKYYFSDRIKKPVLSWSAQKTFRRLGHHDEIHETIIISKSLDDEKVPEYVVEFVVFHEMLHIWHPTKHINGRRYNHTPAFRRDEEKFENFREAEDWINQNVGRLKRAVKRKRK